MLDLFAGVGVGCAARSLNIEEDGVEIMPEAIATRDVVGFRTPYNDVWDIEKAEGIETPASCGPVPVASRTQSPARATAGGRWIA